jgi:alpha-1,3-rhamnosyltransferase
MSGPLVSLLLQSHNHERFLERSVGSALGQTWPDKEVWVVDDGSTDGSHGILSRWSERDGFRYDRQENRGLISTLNLMVGQSKGEFVALQATDDYWHPDKTTRQVEFLLAHPEVDVSIASTCCVDAEGRRLGAASQQFLSESPAGYGFDALFLGKSAVPGASALIRRSALERHGPFDPRFPVEDLWLWLRITRAGGSIRFLPGSEELAFYRLHGSNLHARFDFMERETLRILDEYTDHPLHPLALRRWKAANFSGWTLVDKRTALRRLSTASLREDQTWKGLFKLCIPARVWKRWKRT